MLKRKYLFLDRWSPHLLGLGFKNVKALSKNHCFFAFVELWVSMTVTAGCLGVTLICVTAWTRTAWVASILAPNATQISVGQNVAAIGSGFMIQLSLKMGMWSMLSHFLLIPDFVPIGLYLSEVLLSSCVIIMDLSFTNYEMSVNVACTSLLMSRQHT